MSNIGGKGGFQPGKSGNPAGRPKGARSRLTWPPDVTEMLALLGVEAGAKDAKDTSSKAGLHAGSAGTFPTIKRATVAGS